MTPPIALIVEHFGQRHPALNPALFVEHARVALATYHRSPATFQLHQDGNDDRPTVATVAFDDPDPRSAASLEREDFVEKAAIVMAGLLLHHFQALQITRVVGRGSKVDYFVGNCPADFRWILEIAGTGEGNFASLRTQKHAQLEQSPYRRPPHSKEGFVCVTRFASPAASAADACPAQ